MFNLFKRNSGDSSAAPSLDSVRFDTDGFEARGDLTPGKLQAWFTPDGDGLGLYFFALPPDLPADAVSVDDLRAFYAAKAAQSPGATVVEVSTLRIDGCPAVSMILKAPQRPSGLIYVGSITIPFRDFSFVLKTQCPERGTTGVREALLLDRHLAAGAMPEIENGRMKLSGWNPDDESFDAEFPEHPVSRARKVLGHLASSTVVDAEIKQLPRFALPA